jgi:predicted DNA-binding transcriptional regulator YafY
LRAQLASAACFVSSSGAPVAESVDLSVVRQAIRDERKLAIAYVDENGVRTRRIVWPIALAYYVQATLIGAWCELRQDYRHFRADRVADSAGRTLSVGQRQADGGVARAAAE